MTIIALSKALTSPPLVRHGEALAGLSDAGQWVLDTLREWLRRSRERHQLAGLEERAARHRGHPHRRDLSEQQAVLERVNHLQTTSTQTPARRDGTLLHIARALGRWFSRAANAIGQPSAKPEGDHWADWPRFPPF